MARLFRDNVWKLHGLLESVISDKKFQFVAGLIKKLNKILGIETKLSMLQLRNLSVGLGEEPCIGFTQENSMENSLQELSLVVTLVRATTTLLLP